ncbi:sigma-70 family RNA polymerase sigma factor [Leucobacter coleopterorum]|uniref:Sigma-70 family RNA polymerase sigma factor n=1 Tax=Leucobacter coleopterorum TaxID=2714933 RepID=A0ABX6K3A7_9MICO|nr:sigma-70 family RNA polymerase sigma factor [Leucobacter coleopterorum]
MNTHSENELLRAARTGDAAALAELYRRHVDAARGAAYRIAPRLDTDDLVSEAFAKVLQALQRGHGPETSLRPYLFQVIRNTAAEVSQKQQRISQDVDVQSIPDLTFSPKKSTLMVSTAGLCGGPSLDFLSAGKRCCGRPRSRVPLPRKSQRC